MAASKPGTNRGQFKKGRAKTGGRQRGKPNLHTEIIREALLIGAAMAGDRIAEKRASSILNKTGDQDLAEQAREQGGVTGYLAWAAQKSPGPYIQALAKVMPTQVDINSRREVVHRTMGELQRALQEEDLPIEQMAALLLELKAMPHDTNGADDAHATE